MTYSKPRIALDLDGCYADLDGFLRQTLGRGYDASLWNKMELIDHLFLELEVLPNSIQMYRSICEWFPATHYDIFVLTALPFPTKKLLTADADKREWTRLNLDAYLPVHTVVGGENKKYWVNGPNDLLIDDTARNISVWNDAGGKGIIHKNIDDTLNELWKIKTKHLR